MISKKKVGGKEFYLMVLGKLNQSTNLKEIQKDLGISKQQLNYYLRLLHKDNLIRKVGRGHWEVNKGVEHARKSSKKNIRGHAFIWKIRLTKKYNWKERLERLNIKYTLIRNCIPRIYINNKKVWLGKESITVYESNSYYGENAIESRKLAVTCLVEVLEQLELKTQIDLKPYNFKPAREHFGMIKNDLAVQCNRNGEKIYVRDNLEGEWLWIDDSLNIGELETGGKKALVRNLQVQKWWNDNKKHDFKVTPTFLLNSIQQVTQFNS